MEHKAMVYLEKMKLHTITAGNYVTSVNGMIHPDRIMAEHDFLYILDGTFEIWEDDIPYPCAKDDLLILPAGRHHYGKKPCNPGNRHMFLHTLPTPTEKEANSTGHQPTDNSLFICPSLIHCQKAPQVRQAIQELIFVFWTHSPERENQLSLLFSLLLCELSALTDASATSTVSDPIVEELTYLIHSTPQSFFSAKETAARYGICSRTLNNRFRKIYGKTFSDFQMDTKLDMVRQFLLIQPKAKLLEVALNYGFYDEFHLSHAYKKKFGMSPSQYKKHYSPHCNYLTIL